MSIILTVLIFGIIVTVHEFGHFIVATKLGIQVEEFAIGFGPKLFSFNKNGVEYSFRRIFLGGFCRFNEEQDKEKLGCSFNDAHVLKRIATVIAGPLMNFILAFVISAIIISFCGITEPVIDSIVENTNAQAVGLKKGDRIININDNTIKTQNDLKFELEEKYKNYNEEIKITYLRDGEKYNVNLKPTKIEDGRHIIGFVPKVKSPMFKKYEGFENVSIGDCIYNAYFDTFFYVKITFYGLGTLFTNENAMENLSGPIGLTSVVGDTYEQTIKYSFSAVVLTMLNIMALLSANIGVMNLLPIPAVDGGRLIFMLYELIFRKPFPREKENFVHFLGFAFIFALGIYVAFQDILKLMI